MYHSVRLDDRFRHLPAYDNHALMGRVDSKDHIISMCAVHREGPGVVSPKGSLIKSVGGLRIRDYSYRGLPEHCPANYNADDAAATDVMRLSTSMTMKSAALNVPIGGAKTVIFAHNLPDISRKSGIAARLDVLHSLGTATMHEVGTYLIAEDMGTTFEDMWYLAIHAPCGTVAGCSQEANPSPDTARGVAIGILEAIRAYHGDPHAQLSDCSNAIQGVGGSVGSALLNILWNAGARDIAVSEIDGAALERAIGKKKGIKVGAPDDSYLTGRDVFVPCAMGGILTQQLTERMGCSENAPGIIAGCTNNVLATPPDGVRLHEAGILYAPDYIINAGGIAQVFVGEQLVSQTMDAFLEHIGLTLRNIFVESAETLIAPSTIADQMVRDRVARLAIPQ